MGFLEHTKSFAYTGTHADVDFKLALSRFLDEIEKVLYIIFFFSIHNYNLKFTASVILFSFFFRSAAQGVSPVGPFVHPLADVVPPEPAK
jgi:hypothetical protein